MLLANKERSTEVLGGVITQVFFFFFFFPLQRNSSTSMTHDSPVSSVGLASVKKKCKPQGGGESSLLCVVSSIAS